MMNFKTKQKVSDLLYMYMHPSGEYLVEYKIIN